MCVFLIVILYQYSIRYIDMDPESLGYLEMIYHVFCIFFITGFITSLVAVFFQAIYHSPAFDKKLIRRFFPILRFFVNLLIWVIAGFLILEALNINTKNILAWAGIGGAIVALASKDLLTNLLGSLSILFSRTFEIGDTIRIRTIRLTIEWLVEEITLNHTKVTNSTGEVIYVPNNTIYTESVENLSRRRFYTYEYVVPFAKKTPKTEVQTSLKIIEGKISRYHPISIDYTTENQNATDYTYRISVKLPEENPKFNAEIRNFLIEYIFQNENIPEKTNQENIS